MHVKELGRRHGMHLVTWLTMAAVALQKSFFPISSRVPRKPFFIALTSLQKISWSIS